MPSVCRATCSRNTRTIRRDFDEFLHALADLGVDIYITEFDVCDDVFPDDVEARDAAVARTARQFLETTLRHPAVKMLIAWELADNYSFYRGIYRAKKPHRRATSAPPAL